MVTRSPITNAWGKAHTTRIESEEITIFRGREGAAYNHHHQIVSKGERLFATWSSAPVHEDGPGQRMMLSVSDDDGATWSEAKPLVDRQPGERDFAIVTSEGIHVHEDRLIAYYGSYDYTALGIREFYEQTTGINGKMDPGTRWHQGTHTGIMESRDDGKTWRGPIGRIERFVPNLAPQPLSTGRLVIPGNMWYPYTDDPAGVEGWEVAGIPRLPEDYFDDPEGFWIGKHVRGDSFACCEGSFFETDDGAVHMMLRTETERLAVTESEDGGATYSEPMLTDYTDCRCRFHFGRLPDGRYFGLSCPAPGSRRTPMVLAASENGVRFDRHYLLGDEDALPPRLTGLQKFGRYGYPFCHFHDGIMFVVYSVAKEDIALKRIPLADLA